MPSAVDEGTKQKPDGASEVQKTKEESVSKEGEKVTGRESQIEGEKSDDAAIADTKWWVETKVPFRLQKVAMAKTELTSIN